MSNQAIAVEEHEKAEWNEVFRKMMLNGHSKKLAQAVADDIIRQNRILAHRRRET